MTLSIIIPIFNEEKTIDEILKRVIASKLPSFVKKEIIVVDDGSSDSSKSKIQNSNLKNLKLISHEKNLGKGAAIKTGIKYANGDYIIIQDADLEYDPILYPELLEPILKRKAAVVYGTRLLNYPLKFWGRNKTILPLHLIANKFLTLLTNLLYRGKISDMETGFKIFKKDIFKKISLNSSRFNFEPEITAKIMKLKIPIIEVPITVKPRTYKEGKKIGWKDGIAAIWTLIKYRIIN